MSKFNDGGPAFPRPASERGTRDDAQTGMTLHQYFAGLAMQAVRPEITNKDRIAQEAFEMADAMVAAYEERNKDGAENNLRVNATNEIKQEVLQFLQHNGLNPAAEYLADRAEISFDAAKRLVKKWGNVETIEVHTAPKGAYEALVYDLAKMLGCDEREGAIKEAIYQLTIRS